MTELKYKEITEMIIGAAFEVHSFPGKAFLAGRQECESPDRIGTGVIHTNYNILKAHGSGLKAVSEKNIETEFIILLINNYQKLLITNDCYCI